MDFSIKLNKGFVAALNELRSKYGDEIASLNGLSDLQMSYNSFIDNFVDKNTVADASIDGNANVGTKDVCSLTTEMSKPHLKLLSFNKIYYELTKKYGHETAMEWLEGEWVGRYYLHDASSATFIPYCYAYDLEALVNKGLFFIDNFNAQPPKHLTTYTDFVGEFVSWTSNRSSGACGLPSFLVYSFYFWKKDCETNFLINNPEYYRDQEFQRIIYKLNQPYLRVNQSAFTNFSIFDKPYYEAIFGGKEFPDGTPMVMYTDEFIEYQKAFMRVVSDIRSKNMMTFPVLSYCLLRKNGSFVDEDFAKWCCRHNMKWADSNFFISEDVTSLSNCCFSGSQKVLTKSSDGVLYSTFKELYESPYRETKRNFRVFHNGNWVGGKTIKLPARDMYKVVTANNKELIITDNHLTPTLDGLKTTEKLTTEDYIMFSTKELNPVNEVDDELTYEQGYLIGMYLGDGSMCGEESDSTTTINLSLNKEKYEKSLNILKAACGDGVTIRLGKEYNNVYPVTIRDNSVYEFIRRFVSGKYSFEKSLNMDCLLQSVGFRKGIVDGLYLTDGGNSNRIYTTSKTLIDNLEALFTSLGKSTVINVSDRTGESIVVIRGQTFNRNYPVYCIRWYETYKRHQKDIYKWSNNSIYFKIKSIEPYESDDEYVYCFEMENKDEPYFTLPNGVITHNCRLVSDIKNLGYFNSLGGTALEVGSVKVNTINLARIAYESKNTDNYIENLTKEVNLCCKTLDAVRHIIQRNAEKGLLPNYTHGIVNMKSQYNTIGILGIYEVLVHYGMTKTDKFGYVYYTDEGIEFAKQILKTITDVKNEFQSNVDYSINIEQVPAERAAAVLMEKDKVFFPNEKYELPLYGNQWIPLGIKTTISEKVKLSAIMDKACSGGSIAHINLDGPMEDFDTAWDLLNRIADAGVVYFAFCTKISACEHNHGFYGDVCPICGGEKVTTYQRIVGFLTPEKTYSKERKAEFRMRDWFSIDRMSEL